MGATAAVSLWAFGIQGVADPWNKYGAILSPGFGYLIGLALDFIISRLSEHTNNVKYERSLVENKRRIDTLYKELQDAIQYGAGQETIKAIELAILSFQQTRIKILALPETSRKALK